MLFVNALNSLFPQRISQMGHIYHTIQTLKKKNVENIVKKDESAGNQERHYHLQNI